MPSPSGTVRLLARPRAASCAKNVGATNKRKKGSLFAKKSAKVVQQNRKGKADKQKIKYFMRNQIHSNVYFTVVSLHVRKTLKGERSKSISENIQS